MRCPYCSYQDTKVIDSRNVAESVRRRRKCSHCGVRFTTYERPQETVLLVSKKNGQQEEFKREKLVSGIRKACAKRPVSAETIEATVDDIEAQLNRLGRPDVATSVIGDMVMERLRQLDGIAYIRFASVYRDFANIEDVKQEADAYSKLALHGRDTAQLTLFPGEELEGFSGSGATARHNRGRDGSERRKRVAASSPQ